MHRVIPLLVFAFVPATSDAKCAMYGLAPSVLSTSGVVVVGYQDEPSGRLEEGDVAMQTGWRFRDGGRVVTPKLDALAPGLAVYRLPANPTGTVTLEDDRQKTIVTLGATTKPAGHKAPRANKIGLEQAFGRRPYARVTVELDGKAPDRAVALVLADAKGNPMSWGRVTAGASSVVVHSAGRCRALPNGTQAPSVNQKVTLFWVDDAGAKSPLSKASSVSGTIDKDRE